MEIQDFCELFRVKLPREHWDQIEIIEESIGKYQYKQPIEHKDFKQFYYIPRFEDYVISKYGLLLRLDWRKIMKGNIRFSDDPDRRVGYVRHGMVNNLGQSKIVPLHRLIAYALLYNDKPETHYVVNHKDGDGLHNWLSNLEWCTIEDNNIHAIETGLNSGRSAKPVIFRDRNTGKITTYRSVASCAKTTGISRTIIDNRVQNPGKYYDDGLDFKYVDDQPWPKITVLHRYGSTSSIAARNVLTGEIAFYKDAHACTKATGVHRSVVSYHCRERIITPTDCYNFRYYPADYTFPDHCEKSKLMFAEPDYRGQTFGCIVYDENDVEIGFYPSVKKACDGLGVNLAALHFRLRANRLIGGIRLCYHDPSVVDKFIEYS